MQRISPEALHSEFKRILLKKGFIESKAEKCAKIFSENTVDGVHSHGINRFPTFLKYIDEGYIDVNAEPTPVFSDGAYEVWDGNLGPGNLNASKTMDRAIEVAETHGLACVALRNTNHWMRGGTYGWQAAEAGCMAICFTNTLPNMPAWGGKTPTLGNNPFVMAVPRSSGHVVLDMAMSQYSYGKLQSYQMSGEKLPFYGGFNSNGELTDDPEEILKSKRILPAGMYKGSGLSFLLDLFLTVLSGGKSVEEIGKLNDEFGVSQVFICFKIKNRDQSFYDTIADKAIRFIHQDHSGANSVSYPGERTLKRRNENLKLGIPVDEEIWKRLKDL